MPQRRVEPIHCLQADWPKMLRIPCSTLTEDRGQVHYHYPVHENKCAVITWQYTTIYTSSMVRMSINSLLCGVWWINIEDVTLDILKHS